MKTLVGKATVVAAFTCCITPLVSVAQNFLGQSRVVNRSVDRLTLLPGPNLLSPARTTPTMMPSPMKLGATPLFYFMPYGAPIVGNNGTTFVPLFSNPKANIQPVDQAVPTTTPPGMRPSPEVLRFNSTLDATPAPVRFQFQRAPTRI